MPFRDSQRHLRDILESLDLVTRFIGQMSFREYEQDEKTKAAVERKLQIITEAIMRLEIECAEAYPEIDGKPIGEWATSYATPITESLTKSFGIR